jgi:hypothetical protein
MLRSARGEASVQLAPRALRVSTPRSGPGCVTQPGISPTKATIVHLSAEKAAVKLSTCSQRRK